MKGGTVYKRTFGLVLTVCILAVSTMFFLSSQSRFQFFQDGDMSKLSHWEKMTINDPNVTDLRSLASSQRSDIMIVNRKDSYLVGDVVEVLVAIKDGYGRRKTRGGDEVRIWSRGSGYTGSLGAVQDLGDGTYLGRVKIFWAGHIQIKAGVFFPRETIAFLFRTVRIGAAQYYHTANFSDGSITENVRCTASKETALKFPEICDLTQQNNGLPWYCARPKRVPGSKWSLHIEKHRPLPGTAVDIQMMKSTMIRSTMNMSISITSKKRWKASKSTSEVRNNLLAIIPCNKILPHLTWQARTPLGYASDGKWLSSFCSSDYSLSVKPTSQCLSGRRFWLLGDSTTRQLYVYLMQALKLQQTTQPWATHKSYNFSVAEDIQRTFSIVYSVHGLPFGYGGQAIRPGQLVATHAYIDSIAAGSKDIVLVHFYSHFQSIHPNAMRHTLRKTVDSIQRLHQRAPEVLFLVKGPHAYQPLSRSVHGNDFWGNIVAEMFREEFVSVQDYVVYLDLWDLTASLENLDIHPNQTVIKMIVNYALSFVCPRLT